MKYVILVFALVFSALNVQAQSHAVKGRAIATPVAFVYSLGIGYEFALKNGFSAQVLVNKTGFDWDDNDGGSGHKNAIIPEIRYYFKKEAARNTGTFIGGYMEFANKFKFNSAESAIQWDVNGTVETYFVGSKRIIKSPGALIGYLLQSKKTFFLEGYLGMNYEQSRLISIYYENGVLINEFLNDSNKLKMRMGINLGFRF